jgi:hypothetical protein
LDTAQQLPLYYQALQVLKTYVKTREEFEVVEVDLDGTITDLEKWIGINNKQCLFVFNK